MIKPKVPTNEYERLEALKSYQILDTDSEAMFDSFTTLAASVCEVPICLISLVDEKRQWFKSHYGLETRQTSRELAFCAHAINQTDIFYIEDAKKDERFFDNPLVRGAPGVIFYAGKPLIDENGFAIGTLCVIDHKPKKLSTKQLEQLKILGDQVMVLIQSQKIAKEKIHTHDLVSKLSLNLPGFIYTYQLYPDGSSACPYSSQVIESIFEVTSEEVKKDASIIFNRIYENDLEMLKTSIKNSAEKMTEWLCDYRVQLPKAGLRWLRGNANPEKVSDGSILWHGYITDITEQKLHENVIAQTVKLASLGEMAAGIAHEINNPLAIIKMSSQQMTSMINREEKDHDKLLKTAEKINSSVERITKIMRGLKSYTNGRNDNQLKNESMVIIAEDTVSLCVEKFKINNVKFNVEFLSPESELMIDCRSVEISQVLLNLLNNAFDAIELIENKWITLQLKNNCGLVQISVTDCGPGIDKQEAEKIFNPFYTTKEVGKGTGLGLSIAHKIINSHGGKIWVDSECKSTRFVFELPAIVQIKKVAA